MGQIITFYSYKGGVGRTMALANIAVLLAQWRYKVLIADWDLEAPGLEYFFKDYLNLEAVTQQIGIIDLLNHVSNNETEQPPNWRDSLINISLPDVKEGTLQLITAGKRDKMYFNKVRNLDINTFYIEKNGGFFVENLRNEWKEAYDFVLIDSRTGITDYGGICTIQLPDILALLFTAMEQSLKGVIEVANKALMARQKLPVDRLGLVSIPIPSKFDTQKEFKISQEWLNRFASELHELYADWLPMSFKRRDILEITKIPYVPYFSFGERLAVLEQGTNDPVGLGYAYETLAALIANNLESLELLKDDRDLYIWKAPKKEAEGKSSIFISYSHKDEVWKDRLVAHLGVLQQEGVLDVWDDRRIVAGEDWYQKIKEVINRASVVVLLVSADFLTSNFILSEEVPRLLERKDEEGLRIFPVIIRPCAWKHVKWLTRMNLRPKDGRPIQGRREFQVETNIAAIADEIVGIIRHDEEMPKRYIPLGSENISLARLPPTNPKLFGREKELAILDAAWDDSRTNIISLVAWGGVGKTALVNTWLSKMHQDDFRGAERVYGWSFYSQGAAEGRRASADQFIASALKWFGDPEPDAGSPWEKGERLAEFVRNQKTLLILDGLEPLQHPSREEEGRIRDPGLQSLVRELANYNPGLCVITTRLDVDDLKDFIGTTVENIPLEYLSDEAGMELLKYLGVKGTDDELTQAVRDLDGHALALMLLGTYLAIVYKGDVQKRDRIATLTKEKKYGGHARQVMESYEIWLKDQPELDILESRPAHQRADLKADGFVT
jgi:hypothetical protein